MLKAGFGDTSQRPLLVCVLTDRVSMKVDGGEQDFGHWATFTADLIDIDWGSARSSANLVSEIFRLGSNVYTGSAQIESISRADRNPNSQSERRRKSQKLHDLQRVPLRWDRSIGIGRSVH